MSKKEIELERHKMTDCVLTILLACSTGIPLNTESSERFLGRPAVAGRPITSVIVVGRPREKGIWKEKKRETLRERCGEMERER